MMGNAAKVSRLAVSLAVDGSDAWARATAAFTYCSVWNISTPQLKNRFTSAEPRLVVDLTESRPGTLLSASSMGRVTMTCIWSMGATPLSMPTTMRGKSVDGKTDTGMVNARYAPITTSVRMTKMTGLEKRAVQCSAASGAAT